MLSVEEAQTRILSQVEALGSESVPLSAAAGRYLIESPAAQADLPSFDNSAMDGYAVRCEDLKSARSDSPVILRIIGKIAAGQSSEHLSLSTGTCCRVFTGSTLPSGADAVLMQEDTRPGKLQTIECLDSARPLEHIRLKGEDVHEGAFLLNPGERLNAGKLSLCAAAGIVALKCGRQPIVGLLATGNELAEAGKCLRNGQIYESNRLTLSVLASQAGALVKNYPIVIDSMDATVDALNRAFDECDYVISSGGVSVGELDYIRPSFEEGGGILDFWRVAVKPGKPFVFGKKGTQLFFGLPGNPVSAFVTFLLMVRPALLRAQHARETGLRSILGRAAERFVNHGDRRHFLRVKFGRDHEIHSAGVQASHMLTSLSQADALLDLQPGSTLETGATVSVLVWD